MRVLITGNMGYVGPPLVEHLRAARPDAEITGLDAGYFAPDLLPGQPWPERQLDIQYVADVRAAPDAALRGVDSVIHLAAVSNDPMGKAFERPTQEINRDATIALAKRARSAGVRSFVFASTCSVYGAGGATPRSEDSGVDPLTAYARSKVEAERGLAALSTPDFRVSLLRFATACGVSPRLRLDLVLNDFVASALATGEVSVLSDGSPWRPLINVRDMARAFDWAIDRSSGGDVLTVNVGSTAWNVQVKDLAHAVAAAIPGTRVSINAQAAPDRRSYAVDFARYRSLAPSHQPKVTLDRTIDELAAGLIEAGFRDENFREGRHMRLRRLERLRATGQLDADLRWSRGAREVLAA